MEALNSSKTQPKTKEKSRTEEDTKMKKKEWKQRKQIGGEMTQMKEVGLKLNFCTNAEVLKLSQSIIELLYHFFPHSTDMLKVETSLIDGEAPVVIRSRNDANSILTAFGKSRNNDENLGRFGTEQVVLDVLLYKFFASSPLQMRWVVKYDYMKEQHMVESRTHANFWRCLDRDSKHNVLCSEHEQQYVVITWARRRLLIYEDAEWFSGPMFDYWKMKNLVQFQYLD
ncbi:hypothetical protein GYH30_019333 [Glycine max]|uniref:Uncharacterized protein n=2 Tax=Glycine subgen. Soja TaxID=1462606 RepID=A0A0R0J751_SOYBN|nr:hypothetical protein GYH30_019333 [Glycine max]